MKKTIVSLLAAVLALNLSVGISAADDVIKMGTAKIDGEMDETYKYSLCLGDLGTPARSDYVAMPEWNNTCSADAYFMYDDNNLYIFAEVTDDDVLTKGEAYTQTENPWKNDVIEFKFSMDGTNDTIKVSVDAYGYSLYGLKAHYDKIDYSSMKYATKMTDTGYNVEISVPCTKGDLDMIKSGKLGILWQLNDLNAKGENTCSYNTYTTYPANGNNNTPVFYNLSTEMAEAPASVPSGVTEAPASVPSGMTPTPPATPTASSQSTAPQTFDPIVFAAAFAVASGAAFVLNAKKR
ncbi:MAG: hypothetical protein IJ428_04235 [Clostridia bacterium]|nr:hypothetical protein [Clostridia bacterium]